MGGETSKHSGSSGTTRGRERKRSGLSSVLAGGDCHGSPHNSRPYLPGPAYGTIPKHIPTAPVKCNPAPVFQAAALDRALTWIPETEAALVTEWNRVRQEMAPAGLRNLKPNPCVASEAGAGGGANGGFEESRDGGGARGNSADASSLGLERTTTAAGTRGLAADPATPGVTSSMTSSGWSAVPLGCDCTPATTGRTTGLTFRVPTTWTRSMAPSGTASPLPSMSPLSSPKVPGDRRGGSAGGAQRDSPDGSLVISALPVGQEYYRALQARWLTPEACALPPATEEEDLNDSVILDAVMDPDGSALSPPVPLGYMIDLFVPQWRAEGLYDQAELTHQTR